MGCHPSLNLAKKSPLCSFPATGCPIKTLTPQWSHMQHEPHWGAWGGSVGVHCGSQCMEVSPDTLVDGLLWTLHMTGRMCPFYVWCLERWPALLLFLQSTLTACKSLLLEVQFSSMKLVREKGFVSTLKISVISLLSISKLMQLNHWNSSGNTLADVGLTHPDSQPIKATLY